MTKNSLFFNGCFDKNRIKSLISWSVKNCGEKTTIDLVENLKNLGFAYATEAGISLGIDDLKIPPTKSKCILEADGQIKLTQIHYKQGYLTGMEKFQQLIDTWHRTSEILKQNVIQYFRSTDILNPVYMMAFSGARGNISQVRQLVGMRGLMSDPQGQILDFPIKSNFREGLTLTEYIISCYGARKGLVDTALKTANSGYLTRRLVDVSHHIIISDFNCKTKRGIVLNTITENQKVVVPLQKRLIGRILAENIYSEKQVRGVVLPTLSERDQLKDCQNFLLENPTFLSEIDKLNFRNVKERKQLLKHCKYFFLENSHSLNESQKLKPFFDSCFATQTTLQRKEENVQVDKLFSSLPTSFANFEKYNQLLKDCQNFLLKNPTFFKLIKKPNFETLEQRTRLILEFYNFIKETPEEPKQLLEDLQIFISENFEFCSETDKTKTPYGQGDKLFHSFSTSFANFVFNISLSYVNVEQKRNTVRMRALFSQVILSNLTQKWSFDLNVSKDTNKKYFYELWDISNRSREKSLVGKKERDFYWQQLVFFLNHVTLAFPFSNQIVIAEHNQEISGSLAAKIATLRNQVLVRSPLTCELKNSLCQLCYGWSLAHGKLVSLGEAVGIIAAQSIGEPGTQLTMRTFHTGGVFSGDIMSEIRAPFSGKVEFSEFLQGMLIRTPHGKIAFLTKVAGKFRITSQENVPPKLPQASELSSRVIPTKHHENTLKIVKNVTFEIPAFTVLFVRNQEYVIKTQVIAEFSSIFANQNQRIQATHALNSELEGEVHFPDLALLHIKKKEIVKRSTYRLGTIWIYSGQIYQQPVFFTFFPQPGDIVNMGSVMGQYSSMSLYNGVFNILPNASNKLQSKKAKINLFKEKYSSLFSASHSHFDKINTSVSTSPFLNHTLLRFCITSIQYKQIGYFLSFSNTQNSSIRRDRFFLSNSLKHKFKNSRKLKKNFYFQSFPKQYQTETGGMLICDTFYINEKRCSGEVFWIPEETYTFSSPNCIYFHFKPARYIKKHHSDSPTNSKVSIFYKKQAHYKKWINKTHSVIFYHNSQGKISSFSSKLNGYTQSCFNAVLSHNKKKPSGTPVSWQRKTQAQRKKLQLTFVANKKESKLGNTFFACDFFNKENLYKKRLGSQILYKTNLGEKKYTILNFRFNPISFSNAKWKKLYFALFQNTRSSILQPQFAWENTKKQGKLLNQSHYVKQYFYDILPSKLNKNIPLLNLVKLKIFTNQKIKRDDRQFQNTFHVSYLENNASKISQNFLHKKNLRVVTKKNTCKLKIKPGWIYFPTNIKQVILKEKNVIQPGIVCFDDVLFDQYSVYFECFSFNTFYTQNVRHISDLQFQTRLDKNTHLKHTLTFQLISNEFNLNEDNTLFMNSMQKVTQSTMQRVMQEAKPTLYSFFTNVQNSQFLSKNFFPSHIIFSTGKKPLRNKKATLKNFIKKNRFPLVFKTHRKKIYNYDKIYFLQTSYSSKKQSFNIRNTSVLSILMLLKNTFSFQLTIKQIPCYNEKKFTRIKNTFIPKFFVLIRKVKSYSFISSVKYKAVLSQQNQNGLYSLVTQNKSAPCFQGFATQSTTKNTTQKIKQKKSEIHFICFSWFNQQNMTQLFLNSSSPDFAIKPYFAYEGYRKSVVLKNSSILQFFIVFSIPKHYKINTVQIQFISKAEKNTLPYGSSMLLDTANTSFALLSQATLKNIEESFPLLRKATKQSNVKNSNFLINQLNTCIFHFTWYLNFSILRELHISNELSSQKLNTKLSKNTFLFDSKKAISTQTPISSTRFFSPFQGEILNFQFEPIEKTPESYTNPEPIEKKPKKYLILTDKDQVTFSLHSSPKQVLRFEKSNKLIKRSEHEQIKKVFATNVKPPSSTFLGNVVSYGTQILENLSIPESGEIIQIHKSKIVIRKVQLILFSRKGRLSVYDGDIIEKNSLVLSLFYQRLQTGDIVQGIPKIEQLFEARKTNQGELLAGSLHGKLDSLFHYYKYKYNHEIAASLSLTKIQQIIINNVQQVYQAQGVTIAEKHLEIIVRQMTSKVQILNGGGGGLLTGEIVDLDWIKNVNKGIGIGKAQYKPVILGITKKSLESKSFISEASFQETTRILTRAAIQRKTDFLKGLKENVILGHVIPAGTGFSIWSRHWSTQEGDKINFKLKFTLISLACITF